MLGNIGTKTTILTKTVKDKAAECFKSIKMFFRRRVSLIKDTRVKGQFLDKQNKELLGHIHIKNRKIVESKQDSVVSNLPESQSMSVSSDVPGKSHFPENAALTNNKAAEEQITILGGHSENFILLNESQIAKRTSLEEGHVYKHRLKYGLDHVMAEHTAITDDVLKKLPKNAQKEIQAFEDFKKPNEIVLIFENLGAHILTEDKRAFDIKIGHASASLSQLKRIGYNKPSLKKLCMRMVDIVTGSRTRGFRLIGGNIHGQKIQGNRGLIGWQTETNMAKSLVLPKEKAIENFDKIIADLKDIKQATTLSPITFIASSVFILIDDKNPKQTKAKLIDFSNPIYQDEPNFHKSKKRFLVGIDNLIQNIEQLQRQQNSNT